MPFENQSDAHQETGAVPTLYAQLIQGPRQTTKAYGLALMRVAKVAFGQDITHDEWDQRVKRKFIEGLIPEVQSRVRNQDPDSLEEAMRLAQLIEDQVIRHPRSLRERQPKSTKTATPMIQKMHGISRHHENTFSPRKQSKFDQFQIPRAPTHSKKIPQRKSIIPDHPCTFREPRYPAKRPCIDARRCFRCRQHGHLIQQCLEKDPQQTIPPSPTTRQRNSSKTSNLKEKILDIDVE